ncbi:MAG: DUF423 domain-containing protein [Polyangiaceae bacterium]
MNTVRLASALGFLAVALGAFGAHGLRGKIADPLLAIWQTGVLYHALHSVVLLALGLYERATKVDVRAPALAFTLGVLLFSGSLYALVLTGVTRLGMVTPFGGVCLLAGWLLTFVRLGREG